MNHFLKKNIANLQGGGKKGGGGGGGVINIPAPPPAELQPPKLGKLQTLASYSYAEIIDLVSDGPIEGLVNQNGQYVQGSRIFESIYFDNTPVKKSFEISYTGSNPVGVSGYSLETAASNISGLWYRSGIYFEKDFTGVRASIATGTFSGNLISGVRDALIKNTTYFANNTAVNDPYLSLTYAPITHTGNSGNLFTCPDPHIREKQWEMTWERSDIAKSIYKGIDLLKTVASSPSVYGEDASDIATAKVLRYNYQNWSDVKDNLLPYYVDKSDNEYPIFAIKFELGSPFRETVLSHCGSPLAYFDVNEKQTTVSSDFVLNRNANLVLKNDIANQVFEKIEIDEVGEKTPISSLKYIDLTYARKTSSTNMSIGGSVIVFGFKDGTKAPSRETIDAIKNYIQSILVVKPSDEKYNYNNVLTEVREGGELQSPLSYFTKVYVDKEYGTKLSGPFDVTNQVLRVGNFGDDSGYYVRGVAEFPLAAAAPGEGSSDSRQGKDFSSYAGNGRSLFVESAIPITHIIENPNVDQVFITIGVRALSDTNQIDTSLDGIGSVQAGSKIPSVIRFKVEIGLQDPFGKDITSSIEERVYQIMGLVDSAALVDIGRAEVSNILNNYKFLAGSRGNSELKASTEIILPSVSGDSKRFVRITRTTYESSSVLIRREISLEKITEIINAKFSYPGSAIIGTKIDSRNISTIPPRSFDLRLKRILIPSNYYPLMPDGKDKRRYKTATEFDAASSDGLQIYKGNWDGTFKEAWADNPAWVLFDMLIDPQYGLGSFIDASQINIWELYKIGRSCDAVDKNGRFIGVDNGYGGKEPRYSINIIMADKVNIFDTLNAIASVFRGNIFYSNSYIDFTDDRLKIPIMEFSNSNVKDGTFSYTNSRKDEEFNVVEVSYLDENDNFKPKIEYVENSDDIRKRGILRTAIDSFGVTSKSLANRIGKHVLYATTKENQAVSFVGGSDALFLKPGDLINVNDELKTQQRNFGRVLDIDPSNGKVFINEKFPSGYVLNEITLLAPTGTKSYEELAGMARFSGGIAFKDIFEGDIPQVQTFKISGFDNSLDFGSNLFIAPKKEFKMVQFTGSSSLKTGYYSGAGEINGYDCYSGIGSTSSSGFQIFRGSSGTYYYNPMQDATSPENLIVTFSAVSQGSFSLLFNSFPTINIVFNTGETTGLYYIDTSSFTSETELANGLYNQLNGVVPNVYPSVFLNTVLFWNATSGNSSYSSWNSLSMSGVSISGGGYGSDMVPENSGTLVTINDHWSLSGSGFLLSGASGLSQPYLGVWQSGGCINSPVYDNANIEFLERVKQGSPFGITMSGVEREIYKVTSLRESNISEYEVSAIKFDTGKFAEIESSQNLNDFYSSFSTISPPSTTSQSASTANVYQLDTPTITSFATGNYDGQNDSLDILASWNSVNGASSYLVNIISPNGSQITASTTGINYIHYDQTQLGFYRLLVSAKNSSLGYTSRIASSGINAFSTATFITPFIKNINIG